MKLSNKSKVLNTPTIRDAEEQLAICKDLYAEEPTQENYAYMMRAQMVLNTKKIELSPEEIAELRALSRKTS